MTSTAVPMAGSRSRRRRQRTIALATAGTALTLLISEALDPVGDGTAENFVAAATARQGTMIASALLLLVSAILLVPAIVGIVKLLPHRGSGLGHAGAVLLTLGAFGHAMAATFYLVISAMPSSPIGAQRTTQLIEHLNNSPTLAPAFILITAFALGLLFSFIALHRAGAIPAWVLGAVIGAAAIEVLAPGDVAAIAMVKQALTLIAFAYLALVHWRAIEPATTPAPKLPWAARDRRGAE